MAPRNVRLDGVVEKVVGMLVRGEYEELESRGAGRGISADEMRGALERYGCQPVMPPGSAIRKFDSCKIEGLPQYNIDFDIWTEEQGESDLTLQLRVSLANGREEVFVRDIRVL